MEKIYRGVAKTLNCKLRLDNETSDPVDLSTATTMTAGFLRSNGATLQLTKSGSELTLTSGSIGAFQIIMNASATGALLDGPNNFDLKYTVSAGEYLAEFKNQINVIIPKV